MISIAEKSRLTVRGIENGHPYFVKKENGGWWIEPVPQARRRGRQNARDARDLADHLDALASEGFSFKPQKKEKVPPCRF